RFSDFKNKGVKMSKKIFFALIIAGLCFGQYEKENVGSVILKNDFIKNLSLELIGSMHFTFEHDLRFGGAKLPPFIWAGNCGIGYQFSPHKVLYCAGSYSYTKNLKYPILNFGLSEMEFSMSSFSCLLSLKATNYTIGCGIDISYIDVSRTDWSLDSTIVYTGTANTTLVRPIVNASVQSNIIYPLYLKIQMESRILHFIKIGSKEIHVSKVQPSIGIGLGYIFNL
ncbi:MAG: hypothetical protein ACPL28_12295, partial [bacterium]